MKKIKYIYRSKDRNEPSIEALFHSIFPHILKEYEVEEHYVPYPRYNNLRMIIGNINSAKGLSADIIHITGEVHFMTFAFHSKNVMMTFHDFAHLNAHKGIEKIISWLFFHYLPFKKSKFIVCVSDTMRKQVVEKFPFTKNKCFTIYNAVNDEYSFCEKKFNKEKPSILVVGTRPNKNLDRIIEAVSEIDCHLIIIGKIDELQVSRLYNLDIDYENGYMLTDDEVLNNYKKADILCFPSLYEGFGRPIAEANAIGRPVLTSNIEPMMEVGVDAAVFVDPYNVESIRNGLKSIINDDNLRNQIIFNGLKNAKRFKTEYVAKKYMDLYSKIIKGEEEKQR